MSTPGEIGAWIIQNLWIVVGALWIMVLFGIGGTIWSFIKWVNRGVKQVFNPWFVFIITALLIASAVFVTYIQNFLSGWL